MRNEIYLLLSVCLLILMAFIFESQPVDSAGYNYGTGIGVSPADPRPQNGHVPRPTILVSTDEYQYTVYDHVVYRKPLGLIVDWEATSMKVGSRGVLQIKAVKKENTKAGPFLVYATGSYWTIVVEMRNGNRWSFIEGSNKCRKLKS